MSRALVAVSLAIWLQFKHDSRLREVVKGALLCLKSVEIATCALTCGHKHPLWQVVRSCPRADESVPGARTSGFSQRRCGTSSTAKTDCFPIPSVLFLFLLFSFFTKRYKEGQILKLIVWRRLFELLLFLFTSDFTCDIFLKWVPTCSRVCVCVQIYIIVSLFTTTFLYIYLHLPPVLISYFPHLPSWSVHHSGSDVHVTDIK